MILFQLRKQRTFMKQKQKKLLVLSSWKKSWQNHNKYYIIFKLCHIQNWLMRGKRHKCKCCTIVTHKPSIQGQLHIWMDHSTLIFENLEPAEKPKHHFSISFFYFPAGSRFSKISVECSVHVCRCSWSIWHQYDI